MVANSNDNSGASQFRRQLIATVAGAFIAMSTTTGVAVFQWVTQSTERRHRDQIEAVTQFAAEITRLMVTQAADWHFANRCMYVAARARRLAALSDLTKQETLTEYRDLLNAAWTVESEFTTAYQEAAQRRAATAAAYYKLHAAFRGVQPLGMSPPSEQLLVWGIMSDSPQTQELLRMASYFEGWSTGFKSDGESTGRLHNSWIQEITKLSALIQE